MKINPDFIFNENGNKFSDIQIKDIYSTNEIKTNKIWDGKPVYRKVFNRGASLASFNHNIPNIKNIWINNDLTFRIHNSGNHISLNASRSGTYCYVNQTTVTFNNGDTSISPSQVFVTLEYTKTTD